MLATVTSSPNPSLSMTVASSICWITSGMKFSTFLPNLVCNCNVSRIQFGTFGFDLAICGQTLHTRSQPCSIRDLGHLLSAKQPWKTPGRFRCNISSPGQFIYSRIGCVLACLCVCLLTRLLVCLLVCFYVRFIVCLRACVISSIW